MCMGNLKFQNFILMTPPTLGVGWNRHPIWDKVNNISKWLDQDANFVSTQVLNVENHFDYLLTINYIVKTSHITIGDLYIFVYSCFFFYHFKLCCLFIFPWSNLTSSWLGGRHLKQDYFNQVCHMTDPDSTFS